MDAHVYLNAAGEWMVSLRLFDKQVDEAGPFEDETDAVMAAQRNADNVYMPAKGTLFSESETELVAA